MIRKYEFKIDWTLLFLIALPTFYVAGWDLRESQAWFFQIMAFILIGFMHVNRYLGMFMLWGVFQYIFFKDRPVDMDVLFNLFTALVVYQMIVLFSKIHEFKKYYIAFIALLAVNVFWCWRQHLQADPIFSMREQEYQTLFSSYSGFFGLPALLGNFAAVVVPMCFAVASWAVPLALIALLFSKSTFSIMAGVLAVLFFFWFYKRLLFWILLAVLGTGVLVYAVKFDYPTGQFERRLKVWRAVEQLAFKRQFHGNGIGNFRKLNVIEFIPTHNMVIASNEKFREYLANEAKINGKEELIPVIMQEPDFLKLRETVRHHGFDFEKWNETHNEFLQLFFESGLVGLLIILAYIFDLYKRFWIYGRDNLNCLVLASSVVAILAVAFGHFPFHVARLAGPYIVVLALFEYSLISRKKHLESIV